MATKYVFLDTEFSQLSEKACLISLALVADSGESHYVEILNGWSLDQCSDFVKAIVLPQLEPLKYGKTSAQAGIGIQAFVEGLIADVVFVTDSVTYDWDFLCQLTHDQGLWPKNASKNWLHPHTLLSQDAVAHYRKYAPHHALKDAQLYVYLYQQGKRKA